MTATVLAALFPKLDSVVDLSIGPLKAKLERNLAKSDQLIEKLQRSSLVQAKVALAAAVRTGRFMQEDDWLYRSLRSIEAEMEKLGHDSGQLRELRQDLIQVIVGDFASAALGGHQVPMHLGQEAIQERERLRSTPDHLDPNALRAFLERYNVMTPEREQLLDDMRWVVEHGDFRDVEQYRRSMKDLPLGNPDN